MPIKIILDTDPGIDDTMAIFYAIAHPEIELMALTSIYGNVSVKEAVVNAQTLLDYVGVEADVTQGAERPLEAEPRPYAYYVHGDDGFGNINLPLSEKPFHERSSAEYMVEKTKAHPGAITIVAVGPLTNLALALELDADIAHRVKEVVIMGGAIQRPGNASPVAEANLVNDPHAAEKVFAASWPIVLAPLDVTMPAVFTSNYLDSLAKAAPKMGGLMRDMAQHYIGFYKRFHGLEGCVPHDVMALTYLTAPGMYLKKNGGIAVPTDGVAAGQTVFNPTGKFTFYEFWRNRPQHDVLLNIDANMFLSHYFQVIANWEA